MKKSKGRIFIAAGAIMFAAAVILILFNITQDKKSGERANAVLGELEAKISVEAAEIETEPVTSENDLFAKYEPIEEKTEAYAEIDGEMYVGIISIPKLGIKLPVMSNLSYDNLKISPCRYSGTAYDGNLIIAAHNYSSHFGKLSELSCGDEIIFIAADGKEYKYETLQTETVGGTEVEKLVSNEEGAWSLTLFTCTLSGQSRVCVRAQLV